LLVSSVALSHSESGLRQNFKLKPQAILWLRNITQGIAPERAKQIMMGAQKLYRVLSAAGGAWKRAGARPLVRTTGSRLAG